MPKEIRDLLHLRPGDKVDFVINKDGQIEIAPLTTKLEDLKGMLPKPARAISLEQMDEAIRKGAAG